MRATEAIKETLPNRAVLTVVQIMKGDHEQDEATPRRPSSWGQRPARKKDSGLGEEEKRRESEGNPRIYSFRCIQDKRRMAMGIHIVLGRFAGRFMGVLKERARGSLGEGVCGTFWAALFHSTARSARNRGTKFPRRDEQSYAARWTW